MSESKKTQKDQVKKRSFTERLYGLLTARELSVYLVGADCYLLIKLETLLQQIAYRQGVSLNFVLTSQEAELLIVTGVVTYKQMEHLKVIYESMPYPKKLMTLGACVVEGGAFKSAFVVHDFLEHLHVDFLVPGCPFDQNYLRKIFSSIHSGDFFEQGTSDA